MTREEILMKLIKTKFRSLRNFSVESGIPNSTLNSMFKKGLSGTSFDTVLKVCSILDCDIYALVDSAPYISAEDRAFFSDYLRLNDSDKKLVNVIVNHQLNSIKEEIVPQAKEIIFPTERTLSLKKIRVYLNSASAGFGQYLEDSDYEEVEFNESIPEDADFGIAILGDSMMPKINDGDVVWVKEQESIEENQIGVFILNGDSLCKKLVSIDDRIYLRSLNSKYNDIPITEYDDLKVIGRVLHSTPFPAY